MNFNVCAEYIWIDGIGKLRSKTRVLNSLSVNIEVLENIPVWNYDGSSTYQTLTHQSEIKLIPRSIFKDPIRGFPHILVLCETQTPDGKYLSNSCRHTAVELFNKALQQEPWFGIEQEYFMIDKNTGNPLGFNHTQTQGQYYCSVGTNNTFGRELAEKHLELCLSAGIKICGINSEVAPGQWEFQIGPCVGIDAGDHLWVARYILERLSEKYGIIIEYDPKPIQGDWNGSGCHTNYSTKNMREGNGDKTGYEYIKNAIFKLSLKHEEHMKQYGEGNNRRMTGEHETSSFDMFSYGVGSRNTSVRVGNDTFRNRKGYFEDRRPSSNCDPYVVCGMLFKTTCLE